MLQVFVKMNVTSQAMDLIADIFHRQSIFRQTLGQSKTGGMRAKLQDFSTFIGTRASEALWHMVAISVIQMSNWKGESKDDTLESPAKEDCEMRSLLLLFGDGRISD